jgi:hypothetical protein
MQQSARLRGVVLAALVASSGQLAACSCGSDDNPSADGGEDSDGAPDDPNALDCEGRSGTRISQVLRTHSDGSSQVVRLHDNEIGETCAFGLAGDSMIRCVPTADGTPVAAGALMYSDPSCTARIAELSAALADPPPTHMQQIVAGASADGCSPVPFHYILGNQLAVTPGTTTLYRKDGDNCVGVTAGSNPYFEIADELTPDGLVGATEVWVGDGRIQMRQLDGEDGSRVCDTDSFVDLELDHPCRIAFGENNAIQCLPTPHAVGAYFAEGGCTTALPLVITAAECDSGARYVQESASEECTYRMRIRSLGAEYTDPYFEMTDTCVQVTPTAGDTAYRVGPAVSGSSMQEVSRAYIAVEGADRLERGDLTTGEGLRFFRAQWKDTMFDMPCAFEETGEGMFHCLPTIGQQVPVASVTELFSDAACATAVNVGSIDLACFAGGEPSHARDGTAVYPVTGRHEGPLYSNPGACAAVADPTIYWALGAVIPLEMLVSGTEAVE